MSEYGFDTPLGYKYPELINKKRKDFRVKYYRCAGNKVIHKEDCSLLSKVVKDQWLWATGRQPKEVIAECRINTYGLKPCSHCFKVELGENDV
jgi:hypothetical protein